MGKCIEIVFLFVASANELDFIIELLSNRHCESNLLLKPSLHKQEKTSNCQFLF